MSGYRKKRTMSNLFIIGNGFDLAHKLPTHYQNFHTYLKENYNDDDNFDFMIPESVIGPKGDIIFDDEEVVKFLRTAISQTEGKNWSNLEYTLGVMDYSHSLDGYDFDDDYLKQTTIYANISSDFARAMRHISDYFEEWIDTIDIYEATINQRLNDLFGSEEDLFLTHNYTDTLEAIYGAVNVCHIQGRQDDEIYFGHGNNEDYTESYMSSHAGSESNLSELDDALRKDMNKALREANPFFNQIDNNTENIYSVGFSYSEFDLIYIREVIKRINSTNATRFLHKRNSKPDTIGNLISYESQIRKCGFRGKITTFEA